MNYRPVYLVWNCKYNIFDNYLCFYIDGTWDDAFTI